MNVKKLIVPVICFLFLSCSQAGYRNDQIKYEKVMLTPDEKQILSESLKGMHEKYDGEVKMIKKNLSGYNYHTDASSGIFHEIRGSFSYAVLLLDVGDEKYTSRAFDIISKTITLQDQDTTSKSCGVWPYYMEEPLATKKAPIDFNWADFNAVSLLDVWMGHQDQIPADLKPAMKNALILAARSIQKRNVGPGYTNIAIMGTYVTYMVSHLFDLPEMKAYAKKRLGNFYAYTLDKGGFSEYNSPTYTIVALDELFRMKAHIVEPESKKQIDSLYSIGWETIARHYHKPTGQWAGPHSRSYSTLVRPTFYSILKESSQGRIDLGMNEKRSDVKIKHQIPEYLMHYFLTPVYPRTETDLFEKEEPQSIGTCYLTNDYSLSTANFSSLWNQRRPFLAYWGSAISPKYLQIRFLHDNYDFSSASFYSQQVENKVLAGINFISNGGDKHISIDRLKEGKFAAKDLRLRFEFGNSELKEASWPAKAFDPFSLKLDGLTFNFQLLTAKLGELKGHWEQGRDDHTSWMDFVFYSGSEQEFDLTKINKAIIGFTFSLDSLPNSPAYPKPEKFENDSILKLNWGGLKLQLPVKPESPKKWFL